MNDKKKIDALLEIFMMQNDIRDSAKKSFKTTDNSITKLFITADLMQFFLNNIGKYSNATILSVLQPINDITCRVGDEGLLGGVHFEIIKGKEKIYQGVEIYHSKLNE